MITPLKILPFSSFSLILLIYLFAAANTFAQQPQWRLANGTSDISIADVDIYLRHPDTVYAIGQGKFLVSMDNGENWDSIIKFPHFNFGALKSDPFNSKIIYASYYIYLPIHLDLNRVDMSTDGGQSWDSLFSNIDYYSCYIEIDPVDLKTVYVGIGSGSYKRSFNQGKTWEDLTPIPMLGLGPLAISPTDNNILYVAGVPGMFKSNDRGDSWIYLPIRGLSVPTSKVAVHPFNADIIYATVLNFFGPPGGVYKSTDGGLSWIEKSNGLNNEDRDINDIVINPKNPNEIFLGMGYPTWIFKTTDGGENWFAFASGLPQYGGVSSIAIDTLNERIYIGTTSGIYVHDSLVTSVNTDYLYTPETFALNQNYPNPFNSSTIITYTLTERSFVKLTMYDILGREVRTLANEFKSTGVHKVEFNAVNLPSAVYFYRLNAGTNVLIRKAVLIK